MIRKVKTTPLRQNQLVVIEKEKPKANFSLGRIFAWMALIGYLIFLFKRVVMSMDIAWDVVANGAYPFSFLINCEGYFEGNASSDSLGPGFSSVVTLLLMVITFLITGFFAIVVPLICIGYMFDKSVLKENDDTKN